MTSCISAHGHELPPQALRFLEHVGGYRALISRWAEGDTMEHLSLIPFPRDFEALMEESYAHLLTRQAELLGLKQRPAG
jgi:hypothetical protein